VGVFEKQRRKKRIENEVLKKQRLGKRGKVGFIDCLYYYNNVILVFQFSIALLG